jgi:hypothetical protein
MHQEASPDDSSSRRGSQRLPSAAWRGRVVVAAVAAGAFAAAGQSMAAGEGYAAPDHDDFNPLDAGATFSSDAAGGSQQGMGGQAPAPEVLPVAKASDANQELQKLAKSQRIAEKQAGADAARTAAEELAKSPQFVRPAAGFFTSGSAVAGEPTTTASTSRTPKAPRSSPSLTVW